VTDAVSVVMAIYNGRRFLTEQVKSVISQLQPGDELIVVDDASTDGSAALVGTFPGVTIVSNDRNVGVLRSFERGLALARHDIVFLCDQDDVWLNGKRSAFVAEFARDAAICVVVSDAELIDAKGTVIAGSFMAHRRGFAGNLISTLWRNRYLGCAMAVRRTLLQIALPFPGFIPMHDMWLGALGSVTGRVVYLSTPYLQYRRHANNLTPSTSQRPWTQLILWRLALMLALVQRLAVVKLGLFRYGARTVRGSR